MSRRDRYYNRAKQEGYRSRASYKLAQLDDEASLFSPGDTVVDLGAAPGGWLQVAAERVGDGTIVGVDLQRITPLEGVETVRGDITSEEVRDELATLLGDRPADVVLSDMAPNMSGEYSLDHARSIGLAREALGVAEEVLAGGGDFVVKVFDGSELDELRTDLEREFDTVREVRPDASRSSSSELYLVCKRRLTAPVRAGDVLEAEVVAEGGEGDGIVKIEGFTVFVPGGAVGETVTLRIVDVKPRFGFAERVD
ncbi:MAG: 23S rRNA (uridine(2552)-2'-O)-methyltransferase [Halobacteriales archaeon]|nr:23S rRNA (uridine(2552)-2'-O)-methyltransferase [Halobacteriales archaeon]